MQVANACFAAGAPHLEPTRSVRMHGTRPRFVPVGADLPAVLASVSRSLLADFQTVAVISPLTRLEGLVDLLRLLGVPVDPPGVAARPGHLALVPPADAKGLESDAVVVLEPAAFLPLPGGPGLLYIAVSRAVQHLSVVHEAPLPPGLAPAA